MKKFVVFGALIIGMACLIYCSNSTSQEKGSPFVVVLGIAQDAGYPHAACKKECCYEVWKNPSLKRMVSCIAVVDPVTKERWIFDATPDFKDQLNLLDNTFPLATPPIDRTVSLTEHLGINGIFLTHAHIGHYTGMMYLGREGIGSKDVPVYVMPRMEEFLKTNGHGPWSQLVSLSNIELRSLKNNVEVKLNDRISVTSFLVPHRDEYSETVGFYIKGPQKSVVFIPDINKWELWDTKIEDMITKSDIAYLDASFYQEGEIPGRAMSEIPHPFVMESMKRFSTLPEKEKSKIRFIHMNHTNPILKPESPERKHVLDSGFHIAEEKEKFIL